MNIQRHLIACAVVAALASGCLDRVTIVRVDAASDRVASDERLDASAVDVTSELAMDVANDRVEAPMDVPNDIASESTPDVVSLPDSTPDVLDDRPSDARPGGAVRIPDAPRLVAPMSTSFLTGATPSLRWELSANTDEAVVEMCADRACTMLERSVTVAGTTLVWPVALTPGTHFWRAFGKTGALRSSIASATWQFHVPRRSAAVTTAWGTTPDFNGDGFTDVAMGAPDALGAGAAYVYPGSASGIGNTPSVTVRGTGRFGFVVESVGDLNGDGFADLAVGAPNAASSTGAVSVFFGSPRGIDASAPRTTVTGASIGDEFGGDLNAAGDVNGDGYGDMIVGARFAAMRAGRASLFYGGPSGLTGGVFEIASGSSTAISFGGSVSGACDADRDGFADMIVGAPFAFAGEAGAAYFVRGGPSVGTPVELRGSATSEWFGFGVRRAGDVDFDGHCDFVVGSPNDRERAGAIHLYSSRVDWVGARPTLSILGATRMRAFGYRVSDARDVDGDGVDDIIVGVPDEAALMGMAPIYRGSATTTLDAVPYSLGPNPDRFGRTVGGHGDFDGDGFSDIVVGAPEYDSLRGQFAVIRGGPAGTSPLRWISSPETTGRPYSGGALALGLQTRSRARWLLL